jgi:hypothetical protein
VLQLLGDAAVHRCDRRLLSHWLQPLRSGFQFFKRLEPKAGILWFIATAEGVGEEIFADDSNLGG